MNTICLITKRLHRDEQGTITILSVFAAMFFAMLLGMVMNVGQHVDGKVRMQNAADAAAYSGGVVLTRGMNALAFTNNMLSDVFAVTAFLREARDQNSKSFTPTTLAAWSKIGPVFEGSGFPKFVALGSAIEQKVPLEQKMVDAYSDWATSVSQQVLPLMENILSNELIPKYQRAVSEAFPDIAQAAAMAAAQADGAAVNGRGKMLGAMWQINGQFVGQAEQSGERTLPVVDPVEDSGPNQQEYQAKSKSQRDALARKYLKDWNDQLLAGFDRQAKMSQFSALWRSFTCGYLNHLLNVEYPDSNLPFVIRDNPAESSDPIQDLERYYSFIGVVYWKKLPELGPGLFKNPMEPDSQAFAEVHLFIPRQRLGWLFYQPMSGGSSQSPIGGVPGQIAYVGPDTSTPATPSGPGHWYVGRVGSPMTWNLFNQSWTCQLAPVLPIALPTILQSAPPIAEFDSQNFTLPNLQNMSTSEIERISPH